MKKSIMLITSLLLTATVFYAADQPKATPGSYGVCGCSGNSKLIELSLNDDATFKYVDNSDPAHRQVITGTWSVRSKKLLLVSANGNTSFHRKWKYVNDGKCIRSRYQLNFRRICVLSPC